MYVENQKRFINISIALLLVVSLLAPLVLIRSAHAAELTETAVRFDRMKISTATAGTVCAKPTSTATEAFVDVVFPTGYTPGLAATFTVNTTNLAWPAGATAWPSIATATSVVSQTAHFPSGDLTPATLYCFNWDNPAAVQIKSSATASNTGSVTTATSVPANIDTEGYSTASIADDQIVVTATVPSVFSFAINNSTDSLGALSAGSVTTSPTPRTATVNTNSKNGWMVWAKDSNTGLTSATAAYTIPSRTPGTNTTLVAGTAFYNTGVTQTRVGGSGTVTVDTAFVGTGAGQGGGLDTTLRSLAASNGTADTAVLTLKNNVAIATTTAAASDYTDTITVVGAGLF